ncbi:MAG TPA: phosphomannomutase/phosphoglucomutase, partial [Marmoricola sp.]|nr:phosphomannomutase/phosphoglucomutase [Marmoricola sp.]
MSVDPSVIHAVFKAYDVRGLVGEQISTDLAEAVGRAFVDVVGGNTVAVGHDMRPSSPELAAAFATGATAAGADVVLIGLCSTDGLYFASGSLDVPGVMFTASHNPAAYNGIKMCRAGAVPVGAETGLYAIRDAVAAGGFTDADRPGVVTERDLLADYAAHLRALAPVRGRRLRVVADAGNGMAGYTAPAVLGPLELDLIPMYFDLDGTFPNHEANPIDPAALVDVQARVVAESADIGLA